MNSNRKGKDGELALVNALKAHGLKDAARSVQYCGKAGDADIIGLPGIHPECKYLAAGLNMYAAMDQAVSDARPGLLPTVFYRRTLKGGQAQLPWLVVMRLSDWIKIYERYGNIHK